MEAVQKRPRASWAELGVFVLWGATYSAARLGMEALPGDSGWRLPLALLPIPFFGGVLWQLRRQTAGLDELQQRIQSEALAIAFAMALMLIMVLGLVELAIDLNPDDWSYRHIWPFFIAFYALGLWVSGRRYR